MYLGFIIFFLITPETLKYSVKYGFINAGKLTLTAKDTIIGKDTLLLLSSSLNSNPALKIFFTVNDTLKALVQKRGFKPLFFERHIHETNYEKHEKVKFDYASSKIIYDDGSEYPLIEGVFDLLSVYYYFRMLKLRPKDRFEIFILSGRKIEAYTIQVEEAHKIKTPLGEFECIKIIPRPKNKSKSPNLMTAYLTKDEKKLPVLLHMQLPLGYLKAILEEKR